MSSRTTAIGMMLGAAALTVAPAVMDPQPVFIWNASGSVPIGLYRVVPEDRPAVPDLVAVMPPEPIAAFLEDGAHLPRGIPLLKRVVGLPGRLASLVGTDAFARTLRHGIL